MRLIALLMLVALTAHSGDSQSSNRLEPYTFRTYDGKSIEAELGRLRLPERRGVAGTHNITVSFVRLRSTSPTPGSPIVWLAGGPGVPGVVMARVPVYFALFDKLRAVGDVILLDQRGTGLSQPSLDCKGFHPPRNLFRSAAHWLKAMDASVRACDKTLRAQGIDVAAYTADASADDVEDLRLALGAAKLSLIGHSYGTVLAQAILRRHESSIDRVVFANV